MTWAPDPDLKGQLVPVLDVKWHILQLEGRCEALKWPKQEIMAAYKVPQLSIDGPLSWSLSGQLSPVSEFGETYLIMIMTGVFKPLHKRACSSCCL